MPDQASPLALDCRRIVAPYVDALYLHNGYRFFAPEPGPSHLVKYELTLADGTVKSGRFPDRQTEWPRLLYHRYFMLSETVNNLAPPEDTLQAAEVFDLYVRSYARHLLRKYNARQVKLTLVEHGIAPIEEIQAGTTSLIDERWYQEKPLGTFTGDEL